VTYEGVHDCRAMQEFGANQPYQLTTHVLLALHLRTTNSLGVQTLALESSKHRSLVYLAEWISGVLGLWKVS